MSIRTTDRETRAERKKSRVVPIDHEAVVRRPTALSPLTLVTSDQREVVRLLHNEVGLSDGEIAEATGVGHVVTVRKWRSATAQGTPRNKDRIDDLRAIVGLLANSGLIRSEEIGRFLRSRNPDLNYRRPLGLLAHGEFERVRAAAEQLLERLAGLDEAAAAATEPAHAALAMPEGIVRIAPSQSGTDLLTSDSGIHGSIPNGDAVPANRRYVSPNPEGGWDVKKAGVTRASSHHTKQADAQAAARRYLRSEGGGELITQRRDGKIRATDTVAPGKDPYTSSAGGGCAL
jgi:hypothetical protein